MARYSDIWVPQYSYSAHPESFPTGQTHKTVCSERHCKAWYRQVHTNDVQVCTNYVQVHTLAGHTHTSFTLAIRHNHPCNAHECASHACDASWAAFFRSKVSTIVKYIHVCTLICWFIAVSCYSIVCSW